MNLSRFSIKRPVFTIVTMLVILILGGVSLTKIPVTLIPNLNPPIGVVVTNYSGASPVEVNEKLTKPLEAQFSTLPGIETVSSTSQEGANFILLQFDWSTSIDDVQLDILQRIDLVPLPEGAQQPRFLKFDPAQFPIIQMAINATGDQDITELADDIEQQLLRTEGVASVSISGTMVEDILVDTDPSLLKEQGLTLTDVVQAIQSSNVSLPGNPIETEDNQKLTTRVLSSVTSAEDVAGLAITVNPLSGESVTIDDVADVRVGERNQSTITRANDEPAILVSVFQESSANTASVSTNFQETVDELLAQPAYERVEASILFDQGDYVKLAINNIGQSLLFGAIFAMLVLFVFLRGIRSPIIVGAAIPYSVVVTFVLMYFTGFSLNIMTLGALALGIGMLVDNSIVVIENIERHMGLGKDRKEAALVGTKEMAGAITASTLTTIAVFVPVIFLSGLIGQLFKEFALTISFSLFASLVVALTIIPMAASLFLKKQKGDIEAKRRRSKAYNNYERSIKWALGHRALLLLVTTVLIAVSVFGLYRVGTEFLPPTDEGFVTVQVELPNGASLDATEEIVSEIEAVFKEQEDVEVYTSLIGSNQEQQSQGSGSQNEAEIYVKMVDLDSRERSVFQFVDDVKPEVEELLGDRAEVEFALQTAAGSTPNSLTFTMTSSDRQALEQSVSKVEELIRDEQYVTEVSSDLSNTVEEVVITIDREKARELGFVPAQIAQTVTDATRGVFSTQVVTDDDEVYSVFVQYPEDTYASAGDLSNFNLRAPSGSFVALDEVAAISTVASPVSIRQVDQEQAVTVDLTYESSQTLGEMSERIDALIEQAEVPESVEVTFGGDRELLEDAAADMILAVILAVVLVYLVMAAQFESFKYPFVILFTVPLLIIGVGIGLFVTATPVSIPGVIGILILVGIVVNNGIVLVDTINSRKEEGMPSFDAIVSSSKDRIRPILMTALTTILGLVPLALGIGEGTEINQPMAIVVIGGLTSSTFFTLYIIPIIYSLLDKETRKRANEKTFTPN
ncbi:MFS transporter [Chryseomicrobium excrementi]|uniref:MFS transporter n=1 Tax=Chryseomicrobium excrementi TaxID=2041346 RepID=A0A2M9F3L5_9BACL|nr:efflux RND transporter permease subunit [Chryseomicrobium excrementi]PJK18025.1 MFS transporter [Chryseomicrobium excrementi]